MRLHIGKAFNSLKLTDYLEEEDNIKPKINPISHVTFNIIQGQ